MKATLLVQVPIILALLLHSLPQPALSAPLAKPIEVPLAAAGSDAPLAEANEVERWLIVDEESRWASGEMEIMERVLQNTFGALVVNGIDGRALLDGYRFRHDVGRYVDEVDGRMAKIDHNVQEITLSDTALEVQNGFAIYHEIGHAVDYRLDRKLSEAFHLTTGGGFVADEQGERWQTADNYWVRLAGRDDREEAAADAFAVLVMVTHAGLNRPVFAHAPVTTDYEGISAALALALQA